MATTEQEKTINGIMDRFKVKANFDSYNEKTTIGTIYTNLSNIQNPSLDDVNNAIEYFDNILYESGTSIEQLNILAEGSLKYRTLSIGDYKFGYLKHILNRTSNLGVRTYLINNCNKIPEFFEFNNEMNIIECNMEWFETHVRFINKILKRFDTRRDNIQNRLDRLDALNIKKEQIHTRANTHFDCDCGGQYTRAHKSQHEKTQGHQTWLQQGKPNRKITDPAEPMEQVSPMEVRCTESAEQVSPLEVRCTESMNVDNVVLCVESDKKNAVPCTSERERILCKCGGYYTKQNKSTHEKTSKHLKSKLSS